MTQHRDGKAWRRYPFYYTVLALTELNHPRADEELDYIRPECETKLKRLKPDDDFGRARIEVMMRVIGR